MTTTTKIQRTAKAVILGVLLIALALIHTSCGTMPKDDSVRLRVGAGVGKSHMKGELKYADPQHESDVGDVQGVRIEASRQCSMPGFENTTGGIRVELRGREARVEDDLTSDYVDVDVTSIDLVGVLRHYFPASRDFRLYGEVSGGFGRSKGLLELNSEFHGKLRDRRTDYSPVGGVGIGAELDLGDSSSIFLQLDYGLRFNDFDEIDLQVQDFMVYLGGEVRF